MDCIIAFRLPNGAVHVISEHEVPKVFPHRDDAIAFADKHFAPPNVLKDSPYQIIDLDEI